MASQIGDASRSPLPFTEDEGSGTITGRLGFVATTMGDGVALAGGDESCTYRELDQTSQGLARWMQERLGAGHAPIALLTRHAPVTIAVELAALALGRPAMPLDGSYPAEHLAAIVADAHPAAIVVSEATRHLPSAIGHEGPVWVWDRIDALPLADGEAVRPDPSDGTFVLYTSGTTGRPKGVVLNHASFLAFSRSLLQEGVYRPGERVACAVPLAFGAAVSTSVTSLLGGAELHLFGLRDRGLPAFVDWLRSERINATPVVPTIARALAGAVGDRPLPALRTMLVGGEAVLPSDIELIRTATEVDVRVVALYATTELMLVSWTVIEPDVDTSTMREIPIGLPAEGFALEIEPSGSDPTVGELVVVGPKLNNGFVGSAEPSMGSAEPVAGSDRWRFRTGDIVRSGDEGMVVLGRADDMVKIRGSRVELGLVEESLRSAPEVATAAVVVVETGDGGRALIGHVAPEPGAPLPNPNQVRGHLRKQLPSAMVPLRVVAHETLPTLANGKVDRSRLAESFASASSEITPPRDDLERRLVERLRERTGFGPIGVTQNLFELGVDSLTAIELLVDVEEEFGASLPASSWIDLATIEDLADAIRGGGPESAGSSVIRVQAGDPTRPPLVLAHDLHGTAFRFRDLAAKMGDDQPVWGLDSPLLDGWPDAPGSISELAGFHADQLVRRFPDGPFHLLGYSWGTLLMVELARELQARGHDVGFVGLVDFGPIHLRHRTRGRDVPRPPDGWAERAPSDLSLGRRALHHVEQTRRAPRRRRLRYLSRVLDLTRRYDLAAARLDLRRSGRVRPELRGAYAWHRHVDLAHELEFRPLEHDVDLFVSDQTRKGRITKSRRLDYASATQPLLGWDGVVIGSIRQHALVGPHNDLVEPPYVHAVGAVIRDVFDQYLAATGQVIPP